MSAEQISQSKLSESHRDKKGKYFYPLLSLSAVGLIFLLARPILMTTVDNPPAESIAILPVETIEVEPIDSYRVSRTYTGEVAAVRTSNLGFDRGGEIAEIYIEEGDSRYEGTGIS